MIDHSKQVSKRKVSLDSILQRINKISKQNQAQQQNSEIRTRSIDN